MKVLFCAYDSPDYVGGPNVWLCRLLPLLRDKGVQPEVLLMTTHTGEGATSRKLRALGLPVEEFSFLACTEDKVRWLLERVDRTRPDVFVPNLSVPAFYIAGIVRRAGIPTVGVLHSDDSFHHALLDQFVFGEPGNTLTAVVAVSSFLDKAARQQHSTTTVQRIPYGVPYPLHPATPPTDSLRLLYTGRLVQEQKRIREVAHSLCQAARSISGVEAVLYGEGSERSDVEQILASEGKGLSVRLGGRLEIDSMEAALLEQHVLVLLSDYEGLPISLLEAMACGVVPICLRTRSGMDELVVHEETGLLVNDRDGDFVRAVRRLREEPGLWERLSASARRRVAEQFTTERCAEEWAAFLEELSEKSLPGDPSCLYSLPVLPPVRPEFAREDFRRPALPERLYRATRRAVGQFYRTLHPRRVG